MTGVPSQWSAVALWADVRVIGAIVLICAVCLCLWAAVCFGLSTAVQATATAISQLVRSVRRS